MAARRKTARRASRNSSFLDAGYFSAYGAHGVDVRIKRVAVDKAFVLTTGVGDDRVSLDGLSAGFVGMVDAGGNDTVTLGVVDTSFLFHRGFEKRLLGSSRS